MRWQTSSYTTTVLQNSQRCTTPTHLSYEETFVMSRSRKFSPQSHREHRENIGRARGIFNVQLLVISYHTIHWSLVTEKRGSGGESHSNCFFSSLCSPCLCGRKSYSEILLRCLLCLCGKKPIARNIAFIAH